MQKSEMPSFRQGEKRQGAGLPWYQVKADRIAQSIHQGMNLGTQSTFAPEL